MGNEKGIQHSPNIQANVIESLAWYVTLQELSGDLAKDRESTKRQLLALKQEAVNRYNVAAKAVRDMELRMQKLDVVPRPKDKPYRCVRRSANATRTR